MTDIHSEEPDELLATPEMRRKALEMLRSRGYRALNDVEKMLGWEGMTDRRMAQQLGVTKSQLRYMMFRDEVQKKAKKRRVAKKEARNIEFTTYRSSKLKFTISFPADWRVTTDMLQIESYGIAVEQIYTAFQNVFPNSGVSLEDYKREVSAREAYNRLMENPETFLVSFPELKEQYERDLQRQRQAKENRVELAQMVQGLFRASLPNSEDDPSVEITKLKFTKSMAALDLYELDKLPAEQVPMGSRPSKGVDVDGFHGVKYYYLLNTGERIKLREMPKFFNVYLAENDEGWIISCSCKQKAFNNYKPVFENIIGSFRRAQIIK